MISFIFFFFNELDICKYLGNFILSLSRNSWYIVKQVGNVLYNCFFVFLLEILLSRYILCMYNNTFHL